MGDANTESFGKAEAGGAPRRFECRTCGRQFDTFQALGGHRTSHARRRQTAMLAKPPLKVSRVHACPVCGAAFPMGQALGGHMRRHRLGTKEEDGAVAMTSTMRKQLQWLDLNLPPLETELQLQFESSCDHGGLSSSSADNNMFSTTLCSSYSD